MTREEAIRELKQFSGTTQLKLSANSWEALNRAIKALEQEHCEDCVSRKTVLNTLNRMDSVLDEDRTVETYKELLIACYNDLPPVTPTQNWIHVSERLPEMPFGCIVTVEEDDRNGEPQNVLYSEPVGYDGETWNRADGEPISFEVVAWMQLPEPYKEREDKK